MISWLTALRNLTLPKYNSTFGQIINILAYLFNSFRTKWSSNSNYLETKNCIQVFVSVQSEIIFFVEHFPSCVLCKTKFSWSQIAILLAFPNN